MLVCDVAELRCFRWYRGREGAVAMGITTPAWAIALRQPNEYAVWPEEGRFVMEQAAQEIYRSSNGDRWTLIRDSTAGRLFVRHEANPSSGGQVTDTDVDAFLSVAGSGPEFAALRRLLGRSADRTTPS
jgi:hypothetical protein